MFWTDVWNIEAQPARQGRRRILRRRYASHITVVLSKAAHSGPSVCLRARAPCPLRVSRPGADRATCSKQACCTLSVQCELQARACSASCRSFRFRVSGQDMAIPCLLHSRTCAIIVGSLGTSIVTVPCSIRPSRGPTGEGVMKVDLVCSWMGCMHWYKKSVGGVG